TNGRRRAEVHGDRVHDPDGGLTHVFPSAATLAGVNPDSLGLPRARRRAVSRLATALADGTVLLDPGTDWDRARAQLAAIDGIGPWTCELIALRGLGDPDAFPVTDLGVRRGAAAAGLPATPAALTARAEAWRPWRSYAVAHLWRHRP
nr:DNA-3-methyladenine glycosylase 2 family protein [Acidimicrobiales bacterium]